MRVVMLCKACVVGAYQRKLEEIAAYPDVELIVLVPPHWRERHNRQVLERAYTRGYILKTIPIVFSGSHHIHFFPTLGRELKRLRPQVFHIDEEPYNFTTWLAVHYARSQRILSMFFTWQNMYRRYPFPFSSFEQYVYQHADFAVAGSQGALKVLRSKGFRGPIRVIPQFGVDPDLFHPAPIQAKANRPFTIGFAGRLVPEKGIDVLLRAVAGLRGEWQLHIVGEGPEQHALKRLAEELGLTQQVHWQPRIPSVKMPTFYQRLDVFVLPSRSRPNWIEQFGRVLIEAMACEVPVVGSTCGEIPHVIGDAGLIFPEEDAITLRHHLQVLMEDADLRTILGRRGRERVLTYFTHQRIAEETVSLYRHLAYDIGVPPVLSRR